MLTLIGGNKRCCGVYHNEYTVTQWINSGHLHIIATLTLLLG